MRDYVSNERRGMTYTVAYIAIAAILLALTLTLTGVKQNATGTAGFDEGIEQLDDVEQIGER